MEERSDELLMLSVAQGGLSDLGELFNRYQVRLYNFFLRLTADEETSEDLTQALFCRVIKYKHNYRLERGSFKTWVYQMARNLHLDHCKSESKIKKAFVPLEDGHGNRTMQEMDYAEEDYARLERALERLSPEQRQLLVLKRFEGLKYEEIAGMMKLSAAAVRVRAHRTIQELREVFFKDEQ